MQTDYSTIDDGLTIAVFAKPISVVTVQAIKAQASQPPIYQPKPFSHANP